MKASDELVEHFAEVLRPHDTDERRTRYINGDFPRSDRVQDLDKRYRWDLLWAADPRGDDLVQKAYKEFLNDNHIDTVLRAVVPAL